MVTSAATKRPAYLPPPTFYDDLMVETKKAADATAAMQIAWQFYRGIWQPAANDGKSGRKKIAFVHIDDQYGFMDDGELPVAGSYKCSMRDTHLCYRRGGDITTHVLSGDQHPPIAIFFPVWWVAGKDWTDDFSHKYHYGDHPLDNTVISLEAVEEGRWQAVVDPVWSHSYPVYLRAEKKQDLMAWKLHCQASSSSANIVAVQQEAVFVHAYARMAQPVYIWKGIPPKSENFSPLELERPIPGMPLLNERVLLVLQEHDEIWVGGQAKSHCVLAFMKTLVKYFAAKDPAVLKRVKFLLDLTESVQVPGIDFDGIAMQQLDDMRKNHGIELMNSTDL